MDITTDIISQLEQDHRRVRKLFSLTRESRNSRQANIRELVEFLVHHEVAEEMVVYPALKQLPGGEAVAKARIAEQARAEAELKGMEKLDERQFLTRLESLEREVVEHAELEEATVLPLLAQETKDELLDLGQRYRQAMSAAPTHPHPKAPDTPPGNIFMGPVASLVDRIRDAVKHR